MCQEEIPALQDGKVNLFALNIDQAYLSLFDISNTEYPPGLNIFHNVAEDDRAFVAEQMVSTMKAITGYTSNTPILDRMLRNASRLALDSPSGTLLSLPNRTFC